LSVFEFDERDRPLILQLAGNNHETIIRMANREEYDRNYIIHREVKYWQYKR
jgi:hypothetical protein